MSRITIVLAEDHTVVRQGVRTLLEAEPDLSVLGEGADGVGALDAVARFRPDILLLDLVMPGLAGLEVTRRVAREHPRTRVVVLSMHASEAYVLEALRNGASGYVLKSASATDLVSAVRRVAAGGRYLSPPLSDHVIDAYVARARASPLDVYDTLTTRERQVLQFTAEGATSAEVGARLGISPRTAEAHRGNLMRKLGLRTQSDLVRFAVRRGLIAGAP